MPKIPFAIIAMCLTCALPATAALNTTVYSGWGLDASGNISPDGLTAVGSFEDANLDHWDGTDNSDWAPLGQTGAYTAVWSGYLLTETAGDYKFRMTSDDGSQLFLDGSVLINMPIPQVFTAKEAQTFLDAGAHSLKVSLFDSGGHDGIRLEWQTPGSSDWAIVPSQAFATVVPEPGSAGLWALGLVGLLGVTARRRPATGR
jgi:MYXO-CTERM domain-containing protein